MTDAELCREVAVKVMGWRYDKRNPNKPIVPNASDPNWAHVEDFELSWPDAGRVIERMWERGYYLVMDNNHGIFTASFLSYEDSTVVSSADDESGPRAVFEAALKAVEARGGQ